MTADLGRTRAEGLSPRRAAVLIDDLMFGSRVRDTLKTMDIEPLFVSSQRALEEALASPLALLIVDLSLARLQPVEAIRSAKAGGAAVLAYGSHVDAAALEAGRQAGADQVVPRSVFSARLAELIETLVQAPGGARPGSEP